MAGGNKPRKSGSKGGGSAAAEEKPAAKLPDGVDLYDDGDGLRIYSFDVKGKEIQLSINGDEEYANVLFSVGGSLDKGKLEGRAADLAAIKIMRTFQHDVATRPEGFKYTTSAWGGDGAGARRVEAYERVGFSKPGYTGGHQYAVVKNGKLRPISQDEFLE